MSGPFLLFHSASNRYLWTLTEDARETLMSDPEHGAEFVDVTGDRTHECIAHTAEEQYSVYLELSEDDAKFLMGADFAEGHDQTITVRIQGASGEFLISDDFAEVPDFPPGTQSIEPWYFTFGGDHPLRDHFVCFRGTYASAREQMIRFFGTQWAFQYSLEQKSECIDPWGLTEITLEEI